VRCVFSIRSSGPPCPELRGRGREGQ
jgi:hypothetical protein